MNASHSNQQARSILFSDYLTKQQKEKQNREKKFKQTKGFNEPFEEMKTNTRRIMEAFNEKNDLIFREYKQRKRDEAERKYREERYNLITHLQERMNLREQTILSDYPKKQGDPEAEMRRLHEGI